MKLLVTGDRHYSDRDHIRAVLRILYRNGYRTLIEGEASGADTLAREVAMELGFHIIPVRAQWTRYGKAAGPIRNTAMLRCEPALCVYFHDDLERSRGTRNMVEQCRAAGVEVIDSRRIDGGAA